ncbi:MAG: hypothetical protein LBR87_07055, partial [Synergistaceae bacterium]|nr:hypothetical protein [Synergistaceae bacterium]
NRFCQESAVSLQLVLPHRTRASAEKGRKIFSDFSDDHLPLKTDQGENMYRISRLAGVKRI